MKYFRLMETYKRFEMVSTMEKCLKRSRIDPIENENEFHMPETLNTLQNHVRSDNMVSTPFLVANTPMHGVNDILDDLLTPTASQFQSPKIKNENEEMVSGKRLFSLPKST